MRIFFLLTIICSGASELHAVPRGKKQGVVRKGRDITYTKKGFIDGSWTSFEKVTYDHGKKKLACVFVQRAMGKIAYVLGKKLVTQELIIFHEDHKQNKYQERLYKKIEKEFNAITDATLSIGSGRRYNVVKKCTL